MAWIRKKVFVLVTISLAVGFFLLLGELGVRLFVKNSHITPDFLRRHSVQFEAAVLARHLFSQKAKLATRLTGRKKGMVWEINDKGYRGKNFDTQKPDGTIRVIIYGGSAVFDIENTKGEDWPNRVQRNLREAGFSNVEVINAGIQGHTSLESVSRLFAEGHLFSPDYVLIYNAWNDIKYFTSGKTPLRAIRPALQTFDPRVQYKNLFDRWLCEGSRLYTVLRRIYYKKKLNLGKEGMKKFVDTQHSIDMLNPDGFRQYQLAMETFVDLARNIGAQPILLTQARLVHASTVLSPEKQKRVDYHHIGLSHEALVETFDRLDEIVRKVAAEKAAFLLDASAHLAGKPWAFEDHVHVTPEGSKALAQFVAMNFQAILKKGNKGSDRGGKVASGQIFSKRIIKK